MAKFVARIVTIGKDMACPGEAPPHGLEDIDRATAVLNIGGLHENEDEETAGLSEDVALAVFDFFAGIIAAGAAAFRGFY